MHSSQVSHHKMIWGLEGTFKGYVIQLLYSEKGHLQPDQDSQSSVQSDLNVSRDGVSRISLSNLSQCFSTHIAKKLLLVSNLNQTSLHLKP